uniref:Uncharacterized protein n=1 Tax=Coccidioides posadasii RMSCC 3488 TaxID=454284 RepID=A0A0J6IBC6_COCPO|nr:hypothetical protein CPAG_05275 [Coccidioides posadasii RMSCC 3488]
MEDEMEDEDEVEDEMEMAKSWQLTYLRFDPSSATEGWFQLMILAWSTNTDNLGNSTPMVVTSDSAMLIWARLFVQSGTHVMCRETIHGVVLAQESKNIDSNDINSEQELALYLKQENIRPETQKPFQDQAN